MCDERSWDSGELVATAMGLLNDLPGERWSEEVPQLRAVLAEDDGSWECHDGRALQPCDSVCGDDRAPQPFDEVCGDGRAPLPVHGMAYDGAPLPDGECPDGRALHLYHGEPPNGRAEQLLGELCPQDRALQLQHGECGDARAGALCGDLPGDGLQDDVESTSLPTRVTVDDPQHGMYPGWPGRGKGTGKPTPRSQPPPPPPPPPPPRAARIITPEE